MRRSVRSCFLRVWRCNSKYQRGENRNKRYSRVVIIFFCWGGEMEVVLTGTRIHFHSSSTGIGLMRFSCLDWYTRQHKFLYMPYYPLDGPKNKHVSCAFPSFEKWKYPWTLFGEEKRVFGSVISDAFVSVLKLLLFYGRGESTDIDGLMPFFSRRVVTIPYDKSVPNLIKYFQPTENVSSELEAKYITEVKGYTTLWKDIQENKADSYQSFTQLVHDMCLTYGLKVIDKRKDVKLQYLQKCSYPFSAIGLTIMKWHTQTNASMTLTDLKIDDKEIVTKGMLKEENFNLYFSRAFTSDKERLGYEELQGIKCDSQSVFDQFIHSLIHNQSLYKGLTEKTEPQYVLAPGNTCLLLKNCKWDELCRGIYPLFTFLGSNMILSPNAETQIEVKEPSLVLKLIPYSVSLKMYDKTPKPMFINMGLPIYQDFKEVELTKFVLGYPLDTYASYVNQVLEPTLDLYKEKDYCKSAALTNLTNWTNWKCDDEKATDFTRQAGKMEHKQGICHYKPGVYYCQGQDVIKYYDAECFFPSIMQNLTKNLTVLIDRLRKLKRNSSNLEVKRMAKKILVILFGTSDKHHNILYQDVCNVANVLGMKMLETIKSPSEVIRIVKDGFYYIDRSSSEHGSDEISCTFLEEKLGLPHIKFKCDGTFHLAILASLNTGLFASRDEKVSQKIGIYNKALPLCVTQTLDLILDDLIVKNIFASTPQSPFSFLKLLPEIVDNIIDNIWDTRELHQFSKDEISRYFLPIKAKQNYPTPFIEMRDYDLEYGLERKEACIPLHFGDNDYIYIDVKLNGNNVNTWSYSPWHKGVLADLNHLYQIRALDEILLATSKENTEFNYINGNHIKEYLNQECVTHGMVTYKSAFPNSQLDCVKYIHITYNTIHKILSIIAQHFDGITNASDLLKTALDEKLRRKCTQIKQEFTEKYLHIPNDLIACLRKLDLDIIVDRHVDSSLSRI